MNNNNFETNIKDWVKTDNELKLYNDKIKSLRDKRTDLLNNINNYVYNNSLNNATVTIGDGKLRFINSKITNPLTLKYVQNCLDKFIQDENQVKVIMNYIKDNREYKEINEIKRYYNN